MKKISELLVDLRIVAVSYVPAVPGDDPKTGYIQISFESMTSDMLSGTISVPEEILPSIDLEGIEIESPEDPDRNLSEEELLGRSH